MVRERAFRLLLPATVALFARAPKLGEVKTRLAADLGAAEALAVHEALLADAVQRLAHDDTYTLELWMAGGIDHPLVLHLAVVNGVELRVQHGADLGTRMYGAMETIRREGAWPVVIGCDVPTLEPTDVRAAINALNGGSDLVLAPTEDGGYGLVAMRAPDQRVFDDIAWGSAGVLEQTLERARSLGLTVTLLRVVWDVDTADDYRRWQALPPSRRERIR